MKKFSWMVALLLALSLAFIGCPGDSDSDDDDKDKKDGNEETVVKTLTIKPNPYGKDNDDRKSAIRN